MQLSSLANTQAIVERRVSVRFVRGTATYSTEENEALRQSLQRLKDERGFNQTELAQHLGFKQQTISKLLDSTRKVGAGMSREIANALARSLGHPHAEDLLTSVGVVSALNQPPSGKAWGNRDLAVLIAPRLGIDFAAVQTVIGRFTSPAYRTLPTKWWMKTFVDEEANLALERAQEFVVHAVSQGPRMLHAAPVQRGKKIARPRRPSR